MNTLRQRSSHSIAEYFKWKGDGKETKQRRWKAYRYWLNQYREMNYQELEMLKRDYKKAADNMEFASTQQNTEICRTMKIIGMTTTAAAKNANLIQELGCKIIIAEEAAEVQESHIVSVLSPKCQHMILIGDHQQLRPKSTSYELDIKYQLDISLFERLIKNDFESIRLDKQHRMQPEISFQMQTCFYKGLENHPDVLKPGNRPGTPGVVKNVQFINYGAKKLYEQDDKESTSKVNKHEARFVVELAKYFLKNGVHEDKITILTFYLGQFFEIKTLLKKMEGRVRINCQTVDNFQGQENEIIILSTVRSNRAKKGGFSLIDNRVCVALSRARNSLFVIGNLDMLSKGRNPNPRSQDENIWARIMACTRPRKTLVEGIELACARHPNYTKCIEPGDSPADTAKMFAQYFPEGGCTKPCEDRLNCGHRCPLTCHVEERHETVKCNSPCVRVCPDSEHKFCNKKCWKDCGPCPVVVERIIPKCRHNQNMPCGTKVTEFVCQAPCKQIAACGHRCSCACGEKCDPKKCEILKKKKCPDCGIYYDVKCCDYDKETPCPSPCDKKLACDHICPGTCGTCHKKLLHVECNQKCGRTLICGHICKRSCHTDCPPCGEKCGKRCLHSACTHKCWEECKPCKEGCPSKNCGKLCSDNCDHGKMSLECKRVRDCGHRCFHLEHKNINTGGAEKDFHSKEMCPICTPEIRERYFDPIMYSDFDPDENGDTDYIYLPDCKHSIEMDGLDGWVATVMQDRELQALLCPKCKSPIRQSDRYLKELNTLQGKYERVKARYRTLDQTVDVPTLKRELVNSLRELNEEQIQDGQSHFIGDKKDRIFFRKLIQKSNVAQTLQVFQAQLAYLQNGHKIYTAISSPPKEDAPEREHTRTEIKLKAEVYKIYELVKKYLIRLLPELSEQTIKDLKDFIEKMTFYTNWYLLLRGLTTGRTSDQYKRGLDNAIEKLKTKRFTENRVKLEENYENARVRKYSNKCISQIHLSLDRK